MVVVILWQSLMMTMERKQMLMMWAKVTHLPMSPLLIEGRKGARGGVHRGFHQLEQLSMLILVVGRMTILNFTEKTMEHHHCKWGTERHLRGARMVHAVKLDMVIRVVQMVGWLRVV